jgi:hypothetical protein
MRRDPRAGRRWLGQLALAAMLAACGSAAAAPTGAGANPTQSKGSSKMSADPDVAVVQHALAQDFKVPEAAIKVRLLGVTVPGISVFTASIDPAQLGRHATRTGIVDGGAIYSQTDAMSRVARAWSYGAKRTVPAATVAEVFAVLHSATGGSSTFTSDAALQTFKRVSGPRRAAAAVLPSELTVDGLPAVTYCLTSSARSAPFSVVTAIIKPDFTVELRVQAVNEG